MEEAVKFELGDGIATLTLNRPQAFNAFDEEMAQSLKQLLRQCAGAGDVTAVVITGAGRHFCAGGNLRFLSGLGPNIRDAFHMLAAEFHQSIIEIRHMPKPVIAAVNGLAAGGGFSLALACDYRVMEKQAYLKQAYTSNGLSIDGGGTYSLPRLVGLARSMEIIAFDKPIAADQALAWGLATEVVREGQSLGRAQAMAGEIAAMSRTSFAASKKLLMDSLHTSLESQLEKERERMVRCAEHPNGQEGMRAFLEKRKPVFNKQS